MLSATDSWRACRSSSTGCAWPSRGSCSRPGSRPPRSPCTSAAGSSARPPTPSAPPDMCPPANEVRGYRASNSCARSCAPVHCCRSRCQWHKWCFACTGTASRGMNRQPRTALAHRTWYLAALLDRRRSLHKYAYFEFLRFQNIRETSLPAELQYAKH